MRGIFDYVSSKLKGRDQSIEGSSSQNLPGQSFHLFPNLPPELRRKIWHFALPERVIEASLDLDENTTWVCAVTNPVGKQDRRCLPELFSVNVESREYCLEKYVALGNSYVHPTLDFLYITWYWPTRSTRLLSPKFIPVERQLLSKFQTVGLTVARNAKAEGRFGALVSCLKALGSPQQIIPCLIGNKLPARYPNQIGFSLTNGNAVVILDWPSKHGEDPMAEELLSHINTAFEEEKAKDSDFHSPEMVATLYYMYSGP